jgi:phenylacetate-CoA ligase
LELLRKSVNHALKRVPYYQQKFRKFELDVEPACFIKNFRGLPFLTKNDLREHKRELMAANFQGRLSSKTTGGSTGEAVTILKDRVATAYARATMWRNYGWAGIEIGDKQGRFWGIPLRASVRLKYKIVDLLSNRVRLSSFDFSDEDLKQYYQRIKKFRPKYLYGYASMIYEFASFLQRQKLSVCVPSVITTSEVLYAQQRKVIQEALQCRVMNEYGCGEVGPIAFECPEGGLHLMSDNLYIEVLKEDGTSAQSGEIGQVVVTELHSWAMPLIRYQMMDNVEMGEERCPCGRTLPLIRQIIGRAYDFLKSKSGKRFHGEKVMYFLEHLQDLNLGVKMIQVVQPSLSELRIKVVPTPIFQPLALEMMQTYFYEALGDDVNVHFEMVDQIPREASGKLRVVVCDIK